MCLGHTHSDLLSSLSPCRRCHFVCTFHEQLPIQLPHNSLCVSNRFNLLYSTRSAELIIAEVGEAELWQLLRETDHTHKVVAAVIRTVGASMAEEEGSPEEYSEPIEVTCKHSLPTTVLLYCHNSTATTLLPQLCCLQCCPDFICAYLCKLKPLPAFTPKIKLVMQSPCNPSGVQASRRADGFNCCICSGSTPDGGACHLSPHATLTKPLLHLCR